MSSINWSRGKFLKNVSFLFSSLFPWNNRTEGNDNIEQIIPIRGETCCPLIHLPLFFFLDSNEWSALACLLLWSSPRLLLTVEDKAHLVSIMTKENKDRFLWHGVEQVRYPSVSLLLLRSLRLSSIHKKRRSSSRDSFIFHHGHASNSAEQTQTQTLGERETERKYIYGDAFAHPRQQSFLLGSRLILSRKTIVAVLHITLARSCSVNSRWFSQTNKTWPEERWHISVWKQNRSDGDVNPNRFLFFSLSAVFLSFPSSIHS